MPAAEIPGRQEDKELSVACADVAFLANQRDKEREKQRERERARKRKKRNLMN